MYHRNDVFFNYALPDFLKSARDLFADYSLFVCMDNVEIADGNIEVPIKSVEEGIYERSARCSSHSNFLFSLLAVQVFVH